MMTLGLIVAVQILVLICACVGLAHALTKPARKRRRQKNERQT